MSNLRWRRSTRSTGNGNCVEAAKLQHDAVAVRDSKQVTGGDFPLLAVSPCDWHGLVSAVRTGSLDA